jgi:hypothetical protein
MLVAEVIAASLLTDKGASGTNSITAPPPVAENADVP